MTKIYLDNNSSNSYVTDNLSNAITNLKASKSLASVLNIPYGFEYKNYLRKLDDNLQTDLNIINGIYKKIKNDSKKYIKIRDEFENNLNGIENYSISLRQSAIK